jgi:3-deoxy-D-manno-octulosonic-acid transferase
MRGERPRLVIVPHEPSSQFCRAIVAQARSSWGAQHVALASDIRDLPHVDLDVLVVDQVGFLAELYRDAWIATVGGSFRRSVHSVMEALAAGVFCVLGPHHRNNREALDFQRVFAPGELHDLHDRQQAAIEVVFNSEECRASVEKLMNQLGHHPHWRDWLIAEVNSRTGATQAVLEWLNKKLS